MLGKFNKAATSTSSQIGGNSAPSATATTTADKKSVSLNLNNNATLATGNSANQPASQVTEPKGSAKNSTTLAATPQPDTKESSDRPSLLKPQYSKEAVKALTRGLADAIVDVRVSINEQQETLLAANEYEQILQEDPSMMRKSTNGISTFGNKCSLWVRRRSNGVCSGRLKPIVDIRLAENSISTDLVLAGYTADPNPIAGQTCWIKRSFSDETDKDAIIDLYVTMGKSKVNGDPIWTSPGVGWIRVDGNFTKSMFGATDSFLWYRPARPRPENSQLITPQKAAVALSDEVRLTKLIASARNVLRHYIPIEDTKRLAGLKMENGEITNSKAVAESMRSERLLDFVALFHRYEKRGQMNLSRFSSLLSEVGLKMTKTDSTNVFNFFDSNHEGVVSMEEFTAVLALTDYEIDLVVDTIRLKLLNSCADAASKSNTRANTNLLRSNSGAIGAAHIAPNPEIGKNLIRENIALSDIFQLINTKADDILSVEEVMDLAARLEIFITEEEASKILRQLDYNADDRVTEQEFIAFMRKSTITSLKKAHRIYDAATILRRWLLRGAGKKEDFTTQWNEMKRHHEKSFSQKFPGFLTPQVLQLQVGRLELRLSALEARQLTFLIAPDKNGRVNQQDLQTFMQRTTRSVGELIALVHRELFGPLVTAYQAYQRDLKLTGRDDTEKANDYRALVEETKRAIEGIYTKLQAKSEENRALGHLSEGKHDEEDLQTRQIPLRQLTTTNVDPRLRKTNFDQVYIDQLRSGLHDHLNVNRAPERQLPSADEWALLSILVEADVTEGDIFGVKPKPFIEGLCKYIVEQDLRTLGGSADFDIIVRQLKLNIYREAKSRSRDKKKPDYRAAFDIFDVDRSGSISLSEFRSYLEHLHLVPNLPAAQIDAIMALFDKKKKKAIDFEDFQAFAEEAESSARADDALGRDAVSIIATGGGSAGRGGAGNGDNMAWTTLSEEQLDELLDADEEEAGLLNGNPPITVTKNADCDWLAWHLFRQSYQIEPMDAEGVLTELESYCSEAEITQNQPGISVKEFWNLLSEFKMLGNISKAQFIKGIQLVSQAGSGRDEDRVDYAALVKVAVRMGRAFHAQMQQKEKEAETQFAPLLAEMKRFFKGLCDERADSNDPIPRYEKVFRRLDGDQDGMLTPKEFRIGLLRLQYKDFKSWTNHMVKRLFDECDRNRDGLLSIQEFSLYILDKQASLTVQTNASNSAKSGYLNRSRDFRHSEGVEGALRDGKKNGPLAAGRSSLDLSDAEDEDDEFFRRPRTLNDHQLLKKITDTLLDTVPNDSGDPAKHFDEMRLSVRRFFQRSDPDFKGVASEERFRSFLRRSGLQEALTAAELRRFTDKLKKKGTRKDRYETFIDYEKLCQQLMASTESTPHSKGEIIFYRFQDAAMNSAGQNRSFLSLCSLSDPRLSGKITKDELVHIAKMMECPLTRAELESMLEVSIQGVVTRDGNIDYRALQSMLETYPGRDMLQPPSLPLLHSSQSYGALPSYASPHKTTYVPLSGSSGNNPLMQTLNSRMQLNQSVTTPMGYTITTPHRTDGQAPGTSGGVFAQQTPYAQNLASSVYQQPSGTFEKIARSVLDRLRNQSNIDPQNLRRRFETLDIGNNSGKVTTRILLSILEEYGVVLTSSELHSLMNLYGRTEDDHFFYDAFVRAVEATPLPLPKGSHAGAYMGMSLEQPAYLTPRVFQRYRELKQEGRALRDLCEAHDLDHTGQIPASKFRELLTRTQLLQTQHQLSKVLEDFSVVGQENYMSYEDFCLCLERAMQTAGNNSSSNNTNNFNGSVRDGRITPRNVRGGGNQNQHLLGIAADNASDGPYFSTEEDDQYDTYQGGNARQSLNRFRHSVKDEGRGAGSDRGGAAARRYQQNLGGTVELERGSVDYGMMSPPRVSESYSGNNMIPLSARSSFSQSGIYNNHNNHTRYHTPTRSSRDVSSSMSAFNAPKTSPSKVGSRIWGSHTPLSKKGDVPQLHNRWCCAVCLYTENPADVDNCIVCDSPNYAQRKDYQLKEQCRNCTFLNGEFAEECEMCGEPLNTPKRR